MTDTERPDYEPTPEQQAQWNALDRDWRQVIPDPVLRHAGIGVASSLIHVLLTRGLPAAYQLTANCSSDTLRHTVVPLLLWYTTAEREHMTDEEIDEEVAHRFGDAGGMLLALLEPTPNDLSGLDDEDGTIN